MVRGAKARDDIFSASCRYVCMSAMPGVVAFATGDPVQLRWGAPASETPWDRVRQA